MAGPVSSQVGLRLTGDVSNLNSALQQGGQSVTKFGQTAAQTFGGVEMSAKQMQFALRGIPAQVTDIVVGLQSGQKPLTVLLQQGGQLKDMFGGIGPAARALGGYVAGLVNPFTLAAGAVALLTYAYMQGSKEQDAFVKALAMSGNAAGVTTGQLADMAREMGRGSYTQSKAAETLATLAQSGSIAGDQLKRLAASSMDWERATGEAVDKTADKFKELGKSPFEASVKLNGEIHHLTISLIDQIKTLDDHGRKLEAGRVAMGAYADALAQRSKQIQDNNGFLVTSWNGVATAAKKAWDWMLGIGRDETGSEQLDRLKKTLADNLVRGPLNETTRKAWEKGNKNLEDQIAFLERINKQLGENAKAEGERNKRAEIYAKFLQDEDKFLSKPQRAKRETDAAKEEFGPLVKDGTIPASRLNRLLGNIRDRYNDNTGQGEVAEIRARIKTTADYNARLSAQIQGAVPLDQSVKLTEAEQRVVKIQDELKTSLTGVARAQKEKALAAAQDLVVEERRTVGLERQKKGLLESQEAYRGLVAETGNQAKAIEQQALEQEAANGVFGKSKTAIEQLVLSQMRAKQAEIGLHEESYSPEYIAAINAKAQAQERLVKALQDGEYHALKAKLNESGRQTDEEAQSLQLELSLLGLTREQRDRIVAVRKVEVALAKELAEIDRSGATDDKKQELRDQARANAAKQAVNAENKVIVEEFNRTADSINASLTDALLRGFESGKDFAKNFRDTLKNMFGTLVLRPIIQGIMAPVSGMVSTGVRSVMGQFGSSASGSYVGGTAMAGSWLGAGASATMQNGLVSGFGANMANIATLTEGGSYLTALSAAAPYIAAAIAAVAVISSLLKKGGGPKQDGRAGTTFTDIGTFDNSLASGVQPAVTGLQSSYDALAKQFGASAAIQFGMAVSRDPKGDSPTFLEVAGSRNGQQLFSNLNRNVGRSDEDLQQALAAGATDALLGALQRSGLPKAFDEFFAGIANDASKDVKDAAIKTASDVAAYAAQVNGYGGVFERLAGLSVTARSAMIAAAGGLEALTQATSTYYENFYNVDERRNLTISRISTTLAGVGLSLKGIDLSSTSARAQFRAMVDAIDVSTEAGQKQYVAVMSVAGAFASVTPAADDLTNSLTGSGGLADRLSTARSKLIAAYDTEKRTLESTRDRLDGFTKKFIAFRDSLLLGDLSPLTPGEKYAEAASQFARTVADMQSPDQAVAGAAMERFDSVAQTFLQASRDYNASSDAYQRDFNMVLAETGKSVSVTQRQYDVAVDSLNRLDKLVIGLVDVKDAVLSVNQAISLLAGLAPAGSGEFVRSQYQQLLGRQPDQGGYDYWNARLTMGMTQADLTASIKNSPEYLALHPHKDGLDDVPYDGYRASLHAHETVLNAAAANQWRYQMSGGGRDAPGTEEVVRLLRDLNDKMERQVSGTGALVSGQQGLPNQIARGLADVSSRKDWDRKLVRRGLPA